MKQQIKQVLEHIGDTTSIIAVRPVSGGDINQAYHVRTEKKQYFLKQNEHASSHFFRFEAKGLQLIEETNTIAVPHVHFYNQPDQGDTGILVMDWVEGKKNDQTITDLGQNIAAMHQHTHQQFGFDQDGFIGTLNQPNQFTSDWVTYYREFRLKPLFKKTLIHHRLPKDREQRLEKLIDQLDNLLPAYPKASLLHGDLWGGNWVTGANGKPYVIDPAVFYGDHLFELAFTEVFGGFSQAFYDAYQEVFEIEPYYEDIKPIYQLYYLLVHLLLFGEGYGASVDHILTRYT
ncbi:fructosamine kinase family protein [Paraliobacillus ryukyuensis]|uniref:fructosamine kinase family protein n=1 Tax=Paraliobacillus ryukyuensis TaxID=200904 RepID=UPI0009A8E548|nr:fructosamine kinase family protein [Paraliobacillus ryukyuensis]